MANDHPKGGYRHQHMNEGSKRLALIVVIAPVIAVLAIACLLYFTSPI